MIFRPIITEKSLRKAAEDTVFTFAVDPAMSKPAVAARIGELFKVEVEWVRTVIHQAKVRKTGRRRLPGMEVRVKKAFVKLKKGQKIDLFDFGNQDIQSNS